MKRIILCLLLVIASLGLLSQNLKVSLFNEFKLKTAVFSNLNGKYEFLLDGKKEYKLKKQNVIYFTVANDSISVWDLDKHLGVFAKIEFIEK